MEVIYPIPFNIHGPLDDRQRYLLEYLDQCITMTVQKYNPLELFRWPSTFLDALRQASATYFRAEKQYRVTGIIAIKCTRDMGVWYVRIMAEFRNAKDQAMYAGLIPGIPCLPPKNLVR